jgi:hypothetical protein
MLGIYEDSSVDSRVSTDRTLTNPITMKFTNAGGVEQRKLYLRHEILAGPGAESSSDVYVEPVDLAPADDDVSTWIQLAPDVAGAPGTYEAAGDPLLIGNVNLGATVPFWLKATVPATTEVGAREDLAVQLRHDGRYGDILDLSRGTYTNCSYNLELDALEFTLLTASTAGEYLSEWTDISTISYFAGVQATYLMGTARVSYRTADNSSGANPSAWFFPGETPDLTKDWLQIRLQFAMPPSMTYRGAYGNWLTRYFYGGSTFINPTNLLSTTYGQTPIQGNGSSNVRTSQYRGWFYAPAYGDYIFTMSYSGGDAVMVTIDGSSSATGQSVSVTKTLTKGYHPITWWHTGSSTNDIVTGASVTIPGQSIRTVLGTDFIDDRYEENTVQVSKLEILSVGEVTQNFDIQLYPGPATPLLLDPPNGSNTDDFNPPLTAVTSNGDHIQFQLDLLQTFDGPNMVMWEVPVTEDVSVTTQSPIFDRPSGIYYWRARSRLDGVYGQWTDPWSFTINPFVGQDNFIYLNVNTGFEATDHLLMPQSLYVNVNVGTQDIVVNDYHYYINVNVDIAQGEIIYPIQDRTAVRKRDFTSDSEAFL